MVVKNIPILHIRHKLADFTQIRYYSILPHVREAPFGSLYIYTSIEYGDFPGTYFGRVVNTISLVPELAVEVNASPFEPEERAEIERWLAKENYTPPFRPIEYMDNRSSHGRRNSIGDNVIDYMERNKYNPNYRGGFFPRHISDGLTKEGKRVGENAVRHALHNLSDRHRIVKSTNPLRFKLIECEDIEELIEYPFA